MTRVSVVTVMMIIGVIVSHIIVLFDFIEEAREHGNADRGVMW